MRNPITLELLVTLREAAHLSQAYMASFFGLRDRNSVGAWERGQSIPPKKHRLSFIIYLLDKLSLRRKPENFVAVWNEIMVSRWGWEPLNEVELGKYFPRSSSWLRVLIRDNKTNLITKPYLAPPNPPYKLVGRENLLLELKENLLSNFGDKQKNFAIHGLPGVGKTTFASRLANDIDILKFYSDGVLWANLGSQVDTETILVKWATILGLSDYDLENFPKGDQLSWTIRSLIGERQMLIVIDDVWQYGDADKLRLGGPNCTHLITTRFVNLAHLFAPTGKYLIEELNEQESLELLKKLAPHTIDFEPVEVINLVRAVGGLPLALILIGGYIGSTQSGRRIKQAIQMLLKLKNRLMIENSQQPSLLTTINFSISQLDDESRQTLLKLSVFPPKPNNFSEDAILSITGTTEQSIDRLVDAGLLEIISTNRYTIHQTISDYARIQQKDDISYSSFVRFFIDFSQTNFGEFHLLEAESNNINYALQVSFERKMYSQFVQGVNFYYRFLEIRGLFEYAYELLRKAESVIKNDVEKVKLKKNLGNVATKLDSYSDAVSYYLNGLELARELNLPDSKIDLLLGLSIASMLMGENEKAREYIQEGLAISEETKSTQHLVRIRRNLGMVYASQGDYANAEANLRKSLSMEGDLKSPLKCSLLINLSGILVYTGKYHESEEALNEGIALSDELKYLSENASALSNLGVLLLKQGRYEEGKRELKKALIQAKKLGLRSLMITIMVNLSAISADLGNYKKAEKYMLDGLSLAREIENPEKISAILGNLAAISYRQGSLESSEIAALEALDISQKIGRKDRAGRMYVNLGLLAKEKKQYVQAIDYIQEGLKIARKSNKVEIIVNALANLGSAYTHSGDFEKAESCFEEGIGLAEQVGFVREYVGILYYWGECLFEQSKYKLAEDTYQKIIEVSVDSNLREYYAKARFGMARIAGRKGELNLALQLGRESLEILDEIGHELNVREIKEWLETLTQ